MVTLAVWELLKVVKVGDDQDSLEEVEGGKGEDLEAFQQSQFASLVLVSH